MLHRPGSFWYGNTIQLEVCKARTMFQLLIFARVLSDKKVISFHTITEKIHFSLRLKSRETNILGVLDTALLPSVPKFCCFRPPKYASSVRIGLREYRRLQNTFFPERPQGSLHPQVVIKRPVSPWVL